jgi:predicted hydrocarbon binding protein
MRSENGEVLLLVEDLADCTALRGVETDLPTGHFLRGFIEGFLGSLGMDVEVYETMCEPQSSALRLRAQNQESCLD